MPPTIENILFPELLVGNEFAGHLRKLAKVLADNLISLNLLDLRFDKLSKLKKC